MSASLDGSESAANSNKALEKLLVSHSLPQDPDKKPPENPFGKTDPQFQVLKVGITKLSRWIAGLTASAGGLGVAATAWLADSAHLSAGLQIALAASLAGLLGLVFLSVALVVSADLGARATGTAAPVTALANDLSISQLAVAASSRQLQARVKATGDTRYGTGVRYLAGSLRVLLSANTTAPISDDDWHELAEIDEFTTDAAAPLPLSPGFYVPWIPRFMSLSCPG